MLFPISLAPFEAIRDWECFDAHTGKDSAREIREYYIPDFSNWKDHDSYQKAVGSQNGKRQTGGFEPGTFSSSYAPAITMMEASEPGL